ncbi:MAG: type II toxin-antitoxin system RelE/ParE family toxin [Terracidiphilus sp.]
MGFFRSQRRGNPGCNGAEAGIGGRGSEIGRDRQMIDSNSFINDNRSAYEIRHYLTQSKRDVFIEWRRQPRDITAKIAVDRRINRMELGNFGDHKFCRDGVWEMRIDVGQGYRIYYVTAEIQLILLLCGGSKRTQDADIDRACEYWLNWQGRQER